jgi:tetratricopeptide (TPR) repeat protein
MKREHAGDWLRYIRNGGGDRSWLSPYEDHLITVTRRGIYTPPEFEDAVHLLMEIIPYFVMVLYHVDSWSLILIDALLQAQDLKYNALQVQLHRFLGEANLQQGKHQFANEAFTIARERADKGEYYEMLVASYTGLFKLQWFDLKHPTTIRFVEHALDVARHVSDLALKAKLHDALARAYVRLGETEQSLGHAQMAYIYANALKNGTEEQGRTALALATIFRHSALHQNVPHFFQHAEYFLEIARDKIAHTELAWQYSVLAYESGVLCLQLNEPETAIEWLTIALTEANMLGVQHYRAIAVHAIGLAQTQLERYPEAHNNLKTALSIWKELDNAYEQASILQAMGYLAGLRGEKAEARNYLHEARTICEGLFDIPQRERLLKHIQETMGELED